MADAVQGAKPKARLQAPPGSESPRTTCRTTAAADLNDVIALGLKIARSLRLKADEVIE